MLKGVFPYSARTLLLAGTGACTFWAGMAHAQEASVPATTDHGFDTETIVVEARRRGESAQDVPLVVNAVTADTITKLNLRDFKDIQSVVPGLTMASNANGIGTTSSIRGVNFDVNASGSFGTIEYYLNDAPMTSGAIFNGMFDIGQVEVLRGPQGTLRGKASPSGSITVSYRKPDLNEFGGYAMTTVNDLSGINVNAAVGGPIIPGVLGIRVAGLASRDDGNRVYSINNSLNPFARTTAGRVSLRFEPTDFLDAEATYQHVEMNSRQFDQAACFNLYSATAPACAVQMNPEDRLSVRTAPRMTNGKFDIFTWKASGAFAGQRLYYVGSYLHQLLNSYAPGDAAGVLSQTFCETCTTNEAKIYTHEVRLQNETRVAGLFDYAVGYFHFQADTPSSLVTGRVASGTTAAPVFSFSPTLRTSNVTEESFFGNLTLHLGDKTEFSGGARHITVNQDGRLYTVLGVTAPRLTSAQDLRPLISSGTPFELLFGAPNPREFKKTIFSASAKHNFTDDLMVYANFGTSFRPGNNVVRFPANQRTSTVEANNLFLPAETSKSYELGIKTELFEERVRLNLSVYRQDFKNYPLRSPSGVYFLQYDTPETSASPARPAGSRVASFNFVSPVPVRVNGVEIEGDWRVNRNLSIMGNLSYALGKVRNGRIACNDLNGDGIPDVLTSAPSNTALYDAVGNDNVATCPVNGLRSMTASPWNFNVQAEYSQPVTNTAEAYLRGLVTYAGNSLNDPTNAYDNYTGYARVNLYAGLRDSKGAWEVSVYGKNIFDNNTVQSTTNGPLFSTVGSSTVSSPYIGLGTDTVPGLLPPREFGVTARFAFGSR